MTEDIIVKMCYEDFGLYGLKAEFWGVAKNILSLMQIIAYEEDAKINFINGEYSSTCLLFFLYWADSRGIVKYNEDIWEAELTDYGVSLMNILKGLLE